MESIEDRVQAVLRAVASGQEVDKAEAEGLAKKRKLLAGESWKTYGLTKGPKFALERKRAATDLTQDMLLKGTWREQAGGSSRRRQGPCDRRSGPVPPAAVAPPEAPQPLTAGSLPS